jgi:hypothetical protein
VYCVASLQLGASALLFNIAGVFSRSKHSVLNRYFTYTQSPS